MNTALFPVATPLPNDDGTVTAVVTNPAQRLGDVRVLTLAFPPRQPTERLAGRYLLARCGAQSADERAEQWSIYLRRPLYPIARPRPAHTATPMDIWQVCLPAIDDPGYRWLAALPVGSAINVVGPLGNGFFVPSTVRRMLLLADLATAPRLLPLVDDILDRNGQVSLVVAGTLSAEPLRAILPLAVEIHQVRSAVDWAATVADGIRWADQICAALPSTHYSALADQISHLRYRLEPGFALMLAEADLACGFGACLACVVPLANGSLTRACVHGPVFDLLELAGKR